MIGPVTLRGGLVVPEEELEWRFSRSSGPGGQGVNTADSRVELRWDVSGTSVLDDERRARVLARLAGRLTRGALVVVASEHRSQLRNRQAAVDRLVALVDEALAPPAPPRRAARPSRASRERRSEAERRRRAVKQMRRRPAP